VLEKARSRKLIDNRIAYVCELAKGKRVLDIGVVEHQKSASLTDTWLHKHICSVAASCLGIDILEDEVRLLNEGGYNVIVHDITRNSLSQRFDIIIIGDVIEHLNDPGSLFKHISQMLEPNGRIIISTPNPWYANALLKNIFEGQPFTDSADHVAWFDAGTLCELASRFSLVLDKYSGIKANSSGTMKSGLLLMFSSIFALFGFRPEVFAKTMIYEFVCNSSGA
jgi:2-polyprenyl-3-methyl-5-hydroxy-6-metoxy-1,4-benzoquinol methylase